MPIKVFEKIFKIFKKVVDIRVKVWYTIDSEGSQESIGGHRYDS